MEQNQNQNKIGFLKSLLKEAIEYANKLPIKEKELKMPDEPNKAHSPKLTTKASSNSSRV